MLAVTGEPGCRMSNIVLKARYLLLAPDKVIDNGVVVIDEERISKVTSSALLNKEHELKLIDFGNAVILPGFVNAHSHLELTNLYGLVPPGDKLTSWIECLVKSKLKWKVQDYISSVEKGIRLSLESGTTTIADITNSGHAINTLYDSLIRKLVFVEVIGFDPSNAISTIRTAKDKFINVDQDDLFRYGISPHAPYTVSFELYNECSKISDLPLCTHIAETVEEIAFLSEGKGPFIDLLQKFNMLGEDWEPPRSKPIEYLQKTSILKKSPMLIHCNYITDSEIALIKENNSSVVYCPRSHKFFGHKAHPFKKLLDCGINVAIGTDSFASNYSLSILDEMRFIYENFSGIEPERILAMGTENGSKALGMSGITGKIVEGYYADISVVFLPENAISGKNDPFDAFLSNNSENIFTMVAGKVCYDKYNYMAKVRKIRNEESC